MKSIFYRLLMKLWLGLCRPEHKLFTKSLDSVSATQRQVLQDILRRNKGSEYGRRYELNGSMTPAEYQKAAPLTVYEDYTEQMALITAVRSGILTSEAVIMLEPSSGSTAPSKLIPYTQALKGDFRKGINPWLYDLYSNCPGLSCGKAYWSVTPPTDIREKTSGGIPIGFEEDTQYFGKLEKYLMDQIFAVPGAVKGISSTPAFHYVTLLFLLKEPALTLISVWNPTFLILLLKPLIPLKDMLLKNLEEGRITAPDFIEPKLLRRLEKELGSNPRRARTLNAVFLKAVPAGSTCYEQIWPQLKLISCWTDGNAKMFIPQLRGLFPNVQLQGKGLLATEAFVSLPFYGDTGALLSLRSHFFEFEKLTRDWQPTGEIRLAHELENGGLYTVVVTTSGGLYRYRLQDVVKVVGYRGECPRFKFMGKGANVSDLCGEKLSEIHVQACIEAGLKTLGIKAAFSMVSPEVASSEQGYVLFLELLPDNPVPETLLRHLAEDVELKLRENFHYNYCRDLGQLWKLKLFLISGEGMETYIRQCMGQGQKEGNIKPAALHKKIGWAGLFQGTYLRNESNKRSVESEGLS